jgi:hypothetical protein
MRYNPTDNNNIAFKLYGEMRERLIIPDRLLAKGLSRITPFPTTAAHRRRLKPKPVKAPNLLQADRPSRQQNRSGERDPKLSRPRT